MMQAWPLFLLATCFTITMGVPIKYDTNPYHDSNPFQESSSTNFFDQFQSMFGWGDSTPTTTYRPTHPPHTTRAPPAHRHTATHAPYYGAHPPHPGHPHAGHPPAWSPLPPIPQQGQRTAPGNPPQSPPVPSYPPQTETQYPGGHLHTSPTRSPLPPVPGMYSQPTPSPQYPSMPGQYPGVPQYPAYQYPAQSYYYSPYYNPYYSPPGYYPPSPYPPPGASVPRSSAPPSPVFQTETEDEPEVSHKHLPNKHTAVPNRAVLPEAVIPLPFPVTKSTLPLSILPPEDCHSVENLIGECLSASECGSTSGHPSGLCHMGRDVSLHARVCCVYPAHCGYETTHRVTYIKSPGYPAPVSAVSDCPFTVNLLPGVCQVRLDFLDFKMKPLNHGICDPSNSLLVKSSQSTTLIPMTNLCGTVATGMEDPLRTDIPHLYTHFDVDPAPEKGAKKVPNKDTPPSLELQFSVENYPSKWNIRVSQIICDGANLQAPTGCSQFYNSNSGNITSINLPDREYMADTSLDICLARDPTACAIKYKMKTMGVGPTKGGGLGYGLVCDDFLKFRGEKTGICGKGDGREMVLPVKGPMGLSFKSDTSNIPEADVGYRLEYQYLHECGGLQYFKYPVTKQV